ncbi:MAG TPA: glycogen synthase GlgA [Candidatus Acidoferrum sp.]|nr:glycogen synthase GlgA [Candidatus Acidoferrum sp.]
MRILLASSEVHPYSKTGGLADMVAALGKTLARKGHRVGIVTPMYAGVRERAAGMKKVNLPLTVPLGAEEVTGAVWCVEPFPGLTIHFVEQDRLFDRKEIYGEGGGEYPDNAERFIFFSKAVVCLATSLQWKPEVLHLHDWQASPAALLVRDMKRQAKQGRGPGVCLTVHNLAYQGLFPAEKYGLLNLPGDYFNPRGVEFYGKLSCLKTGLVYSDVITTVSPRYAREVTTEELGCGLDGLLRQRNSSLVGILNGVDYEEWNPATDPFLKHHYSAGNLSGKLATKLALQEEFGLPADATVPLFGSVGRLAEQKGVDIMVAAVQEMLSTRMQFVLVGNGQPYFEKACRDLAAQFPSQVGVRIGFDEGLSHRIEAGADFFLMPSRFEPCGLNQMYGLRYGTIPIVRTTGGLDDTVIDVREDPQKANGIKFNEYSTAALAKGIAKALVLFQESPLLQHFQRNAMAADFSWDRTVGEYIKVYQRVMPAY